mmetsp:Transcript_11066/g.20854  ORF Transcript_11066/g.20854 Transcript_11066/m.20854 type:complete len:312 (-) Transcript_11066:1820-2755(-)
MLPCGKTGLHPAVYLQNLADGPPALHKRGGRAFSAGVLHAGGNGLDADDHRILQLLGHLLLTPQSLEDLGLNHVRGIQVRLPDSDRLLHDRFAGEQLRGSLDLQHVGDRLLQTVSQFFSELLEVLLFDCLCLVVFGKGGLRFAELDVDEVEHGLEEGPLFVHLLQERQLAGVDEFLNRKAVAEPHRKQQPGLGPGEDPGDGAEGVNAAVAASLGRAAANVHLSQLRRGRVGVEESHEDVALALEDGLLVFLGRGVRQLLHCRPELFRGFRGRCQGVLQHCGGVALEGALSHFSTSEVAANGLALNGQPEMS